MSTPNQPMGSRYGSAGGMGDVATESMQNPRKLMETAQSYVQEGYHQVGDAVLNHPATSALTLFGLGMGIGLLVGCSIGAELERSRAASSRWLDSRQAEKFGRQVLDSISDYLPKSITSRLS